MIFLLRQARPRFRSCLVDLFSSGCFLIQNGRLCQKPCVSGFFILARWIEIAQFELACKCGRCFFFYSWSHSLGLCFLARLKPLACFISPKVILDNAQELQENACRGVQCGKSQESYNVAWHLLYQVFHDFDLTWNWPTPGPSQSSVICWGSTSAADVRRCLQWFTDGLGLLCKWFVTTNLYRLYPYYIMF